MQTFISSLTFIQYICGIFAAIILLLIFVKNNLYEYHPSIGDVEMFKIKKLSIISGSLVMVCFLIFGVKNKLIKKDFKDSLKVNKINFVEVNGFYFNQYDTKGLFDIFESHSGRDKCEKFLGLINLENDKNIPIEVIKHCYDKNKYIIISKAYNSETIIGEITTDKFNQLVADSTVQQ